METFVLQHCYQKNDGEEETKMIGVYSSHEMAERAVERLRIQPGFCDTPDCFLSIVMQLMKTIGGRDL